MTGSGHSRRFWDVRVTSAYPPKLALKVDGLDRQFSANSGHRPPLLDHLVGAGE